MGVMGKVRSPKSFPFQPWAQSPIEMFKANEKQSQWNLYLGKRVLKVGLLKLFIKKWSYPPVAPSHH